MFRENQIGNFAKEHKVKKTFRYVLDTTSAYFICFIIHMFTNDLFPLKVLEAETGQ